MLSRYCDLLTEREPRSVSGSLSREASDDAAAVGASRGKGGHSALGFVRAPIAGLSA